MLICSLYKILRVNKSVLQLNQINTYFTPYDNPFSLKSRQGQQASPYQCIYRNREQIVKNFFFKANNTPTFAFFNMI
jgi:hypothetical protein